MNNVFSYDGESGFSGALRNITTPRKFNKDLLSVPRNATHWAKYGSEVLGPLIYGEKLVGGPDSDITCTLCGYAPSASNPANGWPGIVMVCNLTGSLHNPLMADVLTGSISGGKITIFQDFIPILTTTSPKAAFISIDDMNVPQDPSVGIVFTLSGSAPSTSAANGIKMYTNQTYMIKGWRNVSNFQCLGLPPNETRSVVNYELFF